MAKKYGVIWSQKHYYSQARCLRWLCRCLLLGTVLLPIFYALPQNNAPLSTLKAAYVYRFLELIYWDQKVTELTLCVYGQSEAGDQILKILENRNVGDLAINVRRITGDATDLQSCQALYIPDNQAERAPVLLDKLKNTPTVTISDINNFINIGGVIGFVIVDDNLRFDINNRTALQKGIRISAKLLELARTVIR